jgi:molecular chaperone GrpE (heat shock protein)
MNDEDFNKLIQEILKLSDEQRKKLKKRIFPDSSTKENTESEQQPTEQEEENNNNVIENAPSEEINTEQILDELKSIKESLTTEIQHKNTEIQTKEDSIKELHEELVKLRNNFYGEIKNPMINSIISIHKKMYSRINDYKKNKEENKEEIDPKVFMDNLNFDLGFITDLMMDDYNLIFFEPKVGDQYNPKEENAIKSLDTEDENLASTIESVIYGGFKTNDDQDKIFCKALVSVYKQKSNK